MKKAESVFYEMKQSGITPDEIAYCSIINGHAERKNIHNVMNWLQQMIDSGINPGKSTYNTMQKAILLMPKTELSEWFAKTFHGDVSLKLSRLKRKVITGFDNDIARSVVIRAYLRKNHNPEISTIVKLLTLSEGLKSNPVTISNVLSTFLKTQVGRQKIGQVLSYLNTVSAPTLNSLVLQLMVLMDYKSRNMTTTLEIYQSLKSLNFPISDTLWKNFLLSAIKHNQPQLMEEIKENLTRNRPADVPIPRGIFKSIMTILTRHKRGKLMYFFPNGQSRTVPFKALGKIAPPNIYSFKAFDLDDVSSDELVRVDDSLSDVTILEEAIYPENNSLLTNLEKVTKRGVPILRRDIDNPFYTLYCHEKHWTRHAIDILIDRFEKNHPVPVFEFSCVVDDALNSLDPENFGLELHGLLYRFLWGKRQKQFFQLEKAFYYSLFASNHWGLAQLFLQNHLENPSSRVFGYLKTYLDERAIRKDLSSIYTAWYYLHGLRLPYDLFVYFFRKVGIAGAGNSASIMVLDKMYSTIPRCYRCEELYAIYKSAIRNVST